MVNDGYSQHHKLGVEGRRQVALNVVKEAELEAEAKSQGLVGPTQGLLQRQYQQHIANNERILDAESRAARAEARVEVMADQAEKMEAYWQQQAARIEAHWKEQAEKAENDAREQVNRADQVWREQAEKIEQNAKEWSERITNEYHNVTLPSPQCRQETTSDVKFQSLIQQFEARLETLERLQETLAAQQDCIQETLVGAPRPSPASRQASKLASPKPPLAPQVVDEAAASSRRPTPTPLEDVRKGLGIADMLREAAAEAPAKSNPASPVSVLVAGTPPATRRLRVALVGKVEEAMADQQRGFEAILQQQEEIKTSVAALVETDVKVDVVEEQEVEEVPTPEASPAAGRKKAPWVPPLCWAWRIDGPKKLGEDERSLATLPQQQSCESKLRRLLFRGHIPPLVIAWFFLGAILVLFELGTVPLLSFGVDFPYQVHRGLSYAILSYWFLDICFPLLSYWFDDEWRADSVSHVFWDYHSPMSLAFDFLMLLLDVAIVVIPFIDSMSIYGYTFHQDADIWMFRVVRLLRYARVRRRMATAANVNSRGAQWYVAEPAILIIVCMHAFACGLYLVNNSTHVHDLISANTQIEYEPDAWIYQNSNSTIESYFLALQWSMSQFTPAASSEILPRNWVERYFMICTGFVAAVLLAVLVWNLMLAATETAANRQHAKSCMVMTLDYLEDCGASPSLNHRFATWLAKQRPPSNALTTTQNAMENHQLPGWVAARLKCNKPSLSAELDDLIRKPAMSGHALFRQLLANHQMLAPGLYLRLEELTLSPGDVLYTAGKPGSRAHIVVSGHLRYDRASGSEEPACLTKGQWLGEASLWFQVWLRRGRAYACSAQWTHCHLLALPAQQLQELLLEPQHREAHADVAAYARVFGHYAAEQPESWLSDHISDESALEIHQTSTEGKAELELEIG
jgi:hypothetical protein